jgi:hypothetical protein
VPIGVLGLAVFLAIRSDLPDPVATHRGTSGPDGFTALGRVVLPLLIGPVLGLPLLIGPVLGLLAPGRAGSARGTGRTPDGRRVRHRHGRGAGATDSAHRSGAPLRSCSARRGGNAGSTTPRSPRGVDGVLVIALLVGVLLGIAAAVAVPALLTALTDRVHR